MEFVPSNYELIIDKKKSVDFFVPTAAGLNNSLTQYMRNSRCISDDTKPSLEFIRLRFSKIKICQADLLP